MLKSIAERSERRASKARGVLALREEKCRADRVVEFNADKLKQDCEQKTGVDKIM